MSRKAALVVVTASAFLLAIALFVPGKTVLELKGSRYQSNNEEIFANFEVEEGMTFSVSFIHSVNKSSVTETYEVRGNHIYLISCLYSGFGAGVATEIEEGQELSYTENGEMLISNIDMKMNNLSYIVGTVSDHVLELGGESFSLTDLCGKNSTVRFKITEKKLFSLF